MNMYKITAYATRARGNAKSLFGAAFLNARSIQKEQAKKVEKNLWIIPV